MGFTKMVPRKGYQHLVEEIQSAVFNGEYQEGDRLPPEMKLAEIFSTSRGTVREALRVLEQKGLVEIRTGVRGGPVVKGANAEAVSDSIGMLIRHQKVSLAELCEFRELLEGQVAAGAAQKADEDQRAELGEIMDGIRELARGEETDWEAFNAQDALFHRALARAGGNLLIQANLDSLHENIQTYFSRYLPFDPDHLGANLISLEAVYRAVMDRDADRARESARDHIRLFTRRMEANR